MQQALDAWNTPVLASYAHLHDDLVTMGADQATLDLMLGSLERWIQSERLLILRDLWGPLDKATPDQAEQVTVPRAELIEVTGLQGFYSIPRAFLFLYVHAYLLAQTGELEPLEKMRKIVDQIR